MSVQQLISFWGNYRGNYFLKFTVKEIKIAFTKTQLVLEINVQSMMSLTGNYLLL